MVNSLDDLEMSLNVSEVDERNFSGVCISESEQAAIAYQSMP